MEQEKYTKILEESTEAAMEHRSRRSWSTGSPESYRVAVMTLTEHDFAVVTKHMYDSAGVQYKGESSRRRRL